MTPATTWLAGRLPAAARAPQEVTDWAQRLGWAAGLLLCTAVLYWLMRRGWHRRGMLHADLPELPERPPALAGASADGGSEPLRTTGRYLGSTVAGQWLERVVAHGLGTRSRVELTLTGRGLDVQRPGARDFFVPAGQLRGARLDKGIAGKVLTEGGVLVVTWEHGGRVLDSGFRSDRPAEHLDWAAAITALAGEAPGGRAAHPSGTTPGTPYDREKGTP